MDRPKYFHFFKSTESKTKIYFQFTVTWQRKPWHFRNWNRWYKQFNNYDSFLVLSALNCINMKVRNETKNTDTQKTAQSWATKLNSPYLRQHCSDRPMWTHSHTHIQINTQRLNLRALRQERHQRREAFFCTSSLTQYQCVLYTVYGFTVCAFVCVRVCVPRSSAV